MKISFHYELDLGEEPMSIDPSVISNFNAAVQAAVTVGDSLATAATQAGTDEGTAVAAMTAGTKALTDLATTLQTALNSINPPPPPVEAVPQNLTATPGPGAIALAWSAVPNATSYNVMKATTPAGPFATVGSPTTNAFTDTEATGNTVSYEVTAIGPNGESAPSAVVTATAL